MPGVARGPHVEHLRYGLSLMNRWGRGDPNPWATADWAAGWRRTRVTDPEWSTLREALAAEARDWLNVLRTPREYSSSELNGVIASIAHLAYHLGAIRQWIARFAGLPPNSREHG